MPFCVLAGAHRSLKRPADLGGMFCSGIVSFAKFPSRSAWIVARVGLFFGMNVLSSRTAPVRHEWPLTTPLNFRS